MKFLFMIGLVLALSLLFGCCGTASSIKKSPSNPITPFEAKYANVEPPVETTEDLLIQSCNWGTLKCFQSCGFGTTRVNEECMTNCRNESAVCLEEVKREYAK